MTHKHCLTFAIGLWLAPALTAQVDRPPGLLNDLVDISGDFHEYRNTYFVADKLAGFDPASGTGSLTWARNQLAPRIAFSNMENVLKPFDGVTFPEHEYEINPSLPFRFNSSRREPSASESRPGPSSNVFVYRLDAGARRAMTSPRARIWVAKERLGESEQVATED